MNLKRFSCLGLLTLAAIVFVVFVTVFFFVLGKVIFGKELVSAVDLSGTNTKAFELVNSSFNLHIPSINLDHKIVEDIDPTDKSNYLPVIENNIAHGKFTYTPNEVYKQQQGITYLFSHQNADAKIFKDLDKVDIDEKIYVEYGNTIYSYTVISKTFVNPTETNNYTSNSPLPLLRLQTCADGTSKRIIIDAKLQGTV